MYYNIKRGVYNENGINILSYHNNSGSVVLSTSGMLTVYLTNYKIQINHVVKACLSSKKKGIARKKTFLQFFLHPKDREMSCQTQCCFFFIRGKPVCYIYYVKYLSNSCVHVKKRNF